MLRVSELRAVGCGRWDAGCGMRDAGCGWWLASASRRLLPLKFCVERNERLISVLSFLLYIYSSFILYRNKLLLEGLNGGLPLTVDG